MTQVELDTNAIDILNRTVLREKLDSPSDAIRLLDNLRAMQSAVIGKQDNEIAALKEENERLKFELKAKGEGG